MILSDAPFTVLTYLTYENSGKILQGACCRTDVLTKAYTTEKILVSLFNDFISCYSPLSAEPGDYYTMASSKVISDFARLGS